MLKGFFFKQETKSKKKKVKARTKKTTNQIKDPCEVCGLYKKCKSPKMEPSGDGELGILIVGEAGGKTEDARGTQFIGQAGTFLREVLSEFGLDLDKHFWKTNALICPTRNTPTKKQLKLCRPNLEKTIQELKPKFIWLMGTKAVESYYLGRFSDISISKWRKLCIPEPSIGSYIIPLFHPSYVIRNRSRELEGTFKRDIKWALSCLDKPEPKRVEVESKVKILKDINEIVDYLEYIAKKKDLKIAFDYETTGLKPYAKGHKILTVSICYDKEFAVAFPYQYSDAWTRKEFKQIETLWKKILEQNPKIAHNLKYEHKWSNIIIGVEPRNWIWDTMITSHILNCNKPTGLKFQSYINFGIEGYEKELQKYMKTDSSHGINKLEQFNLDKLLLYNGIDSLVTYWLYEKQQNQLRGGLKKANRFFLTGLKALADVEQNGICADEEYYEKMDLELTEKITKLETDIYNLEEVKLFRKQEGREINIGSSKDLKILLYDILKVEPTKFTSSGAASTDHETLAQLNTDFTNKLIKLRKLKKIRDTYLAQFKREIINGKIYPGFNLHIARTFRSCIAGYEKVLVVRDFKKHPEGIPIKDVKPGDYVYCFDDNLNLCIRKILWQGKTGKRKIVRIHYYRKGKKGTLDCTPEHKIRLVTGEYVQAKDLLKQSHYNRKSKHEPKCRVLSCHRSYDELFATNHIKNNRGIKEHRFIYESFIGKLSDDEVVHHIDRNHLNHSLSNLKKMTRSEHSKLHAKHTILTKEARKRNREVVQRMIREGKYNYKRGLDNPNSLNLSKLQCLKMLARCGGKVSKVTERFGIDFSTFKKYLSIHGIDWKEVKLRYDKNGRYISKVRLKRLSELGRSKVEEILGINYYKVLRLYRLYGLDTKRKWANQYGEFVPGNHVITKVEFLDEEVDVYDLEVEGCHNFIVNEICVHNSSDSPNFQNIPVRDEYAKKVTRSGLIPTKGNRILEVDYSSIEVRIAACYTRDPVLVKYINDPSSDMHRDTAKELFLLNDKQVTKKIRFYAKNCFVFPEFYGSWYKNCAANLWENVVEAGLKTGEGILVREHLKNHGIKSYKDFEEHVRQVEENFWNRFKVFKEWQEYVIDFYNRKGYVEMFFGHRRTGYLTKNMIINSPIQGTAFHCLLWSLVRLNKIRKEEGWRTKFVGQIHDSIVSDLYPGEQDYVLDVFRKVMCEDIRKEFDWIIVPLDIEYEMTKINHPWYEKKEAIKDYVQLEDKVEKMWIMLEDKKHGILATNSEPEVIKEGKVWQIVPF